VQNLAVIGDGVVKKGVIVVAVECCDERFDPLRVTLLACRKAQIRLDARLYKWEA